jgi:hypothetical protein
MNRNNLFIRPSRVVMYVGLIQVSVGVLAGTAQFAAWRTEKSYSGYELLYLALLIFALYIGVKISGQGRENLANVQDRLNELKRLSSSISRLIKIFTLLTLVGYGIWLGLAIARGLTVPTVLSGISGEGAGIKAIKIYLTTVSGVTTLTQFSSTVAALSGILRKLGDKTYRYYLMAVLIPGAVRALLNAERLALLEPLVAFLVVQLFLGAKLSIRARIITLVVFPSIFAAYEFTRSWVAFYASRFDGNFWDFILSRLLAYYATALNNGYILINELSPGPRFPFYSFNFLFTIPPLDRLLDYRKILEYNPFDGLRSFLRFHGNPEFNNPNGFLVLVMDWGWILAAAVLLTLGFVLGKTYSSAMKSSLPAMVLYSCLFLGILELPRYLYFSLGRAFPIYIAYFLIKREVSKNEK